jgi:hypothetical protein
MACARWDTCSLVRIADTLLAIVLVDRCSSRPISALGSPAARWLRISSSRGGQLGERGIPRRRRGEPASQPAGERRSEHRLPGCRRADCGQDVGAVGALHEVPDRAGPDRGEHRVVVLEHGQHQHRDGRPAGDDLPGGLGAVQAGQLQVHDHHVGSEQHRLPDRLGAVTGLAGHLDVVGSGDDRA